MQKVLIKKETLEDFLISDEAGNKDSIFIENAVTHPSDNIHINPTEVSEDLLKYILLNDPLLDNEIKTALSLNLLEKTKQKSYKTEENPWDLKIKTISDVMSVYDRIKGTKFNADYQFLERSYPVKMLMTLNNATRHLPKYIHIQIKLQVHQEKERITFDLSNEQIVNLRKEIGNLTFKKLMNIFNFYEQTEDIDNYLQKLSKAQKIQQENGKQILCNGLGINSDFKPISGNTLEQKNAAIIENEWEVTKGSRYINDDFKHSTNLPFIRVFSLFYKQYFYIHIDDISDYVYDSKAFEKLILPTDMKQMIQKIFSYSLQNLTGDIISYKHGGLIIMAEGNPGVGKTSTAEVYSELNQKPLYVVQVNEIGTEIKHIEQNLEIIFRRVERWNAIILFDEIDVFLSKRNDNIEKSAVVGVFLRLMDYFRGIMFLTSNRSDVIDNAVLSRITVNITYPDLDNKTRHTIWTAKLKEAGMTIDSIEKLSKLNLNGRQIRNMVRLGKIIFDTTINEAEYINLIKRTIPNYSE